MFSKGKGWPSGCGPLSLAADPLADLAPARARIDDWRAFLDAGLDPEAPAALRPAKRPGPLL